MRKIITLLFVCFTIVCFPQKGMIKRHVFRYMSYPTKVDSMPNTFYYEINEKHTDIDGNPINLFFRSSSFAKVELPPNSPSKISNYNMNESKISNNETTSSISVFYGSKIGLQGSIVINMINGVKKDHCIMKLDVGLLDILSKRYVLMDNDMIKQMSGQFYGYAFTVYVPMSIHYEDNNKTAEYQYTSVKKDTFTYYFPHHLTGQANHVAGFSNKNQLDSYLLTHQNTFYGQLKRRYISDWLHSQKDSIQTSFNTYSKQIEIDSYHIKKDKAGNFKDINEANDLFTIGVDSIKFHFKEKNYINWHTPVVHSYFQKSFSLYKNAYDEMLKHHKAEHDSRFSTLKDKYYLSIATVWSAFFSGNIDQILKPYIFAAEISVGTYLHNHFREYVFRQVIFMMYQYNVNKEKRGWIIPINE